MEDSASKEASELVPRILDTSIQSNDTCTQTSCFFRLVLVFKGLSMSPARPIRCFWPTFSSFDAVYNTTHIRHTNNAWSPIGQQERAPLWQHRPSNIYSIVQEKYPIWSCQKLGRGPRNIGNNTNLGFLRIWIFASVHSLLTATCYR
jgi:hypothetical protein